MKISKKIILSIVMLVLLTLLFFLISQTYSKYLTSISGNASIAISRWNIKVNDESIKNNSDISSRITPVFPGNEHIASNIIAPTAEGYFDLIFDYTDVDVSFKYDINISADENSAVSDIVATGFSINSGEKITFTDFNSSISDTITLNHTENTRSIRVYVMWNDDPDTSSMNNIDDTYSTMKANSSAILKVSVAFTQVVQ